MKKIIYTVLAFSALSVSAQNETQGEGFESYVQNTSFFKTPPIRSFLGSESAKTQTSFDDAKAKDGKKTNDIVNDIGIPENNGIDPALQTTPARHKTGLKTKTNVNGLTGSFPPDPSGAAGMDYYVQAVNVSYRVYEKDGSGVGGASSLASLWPGSTSEGDPIIMYDRFAERWFISQFQPDSDEILIAISETADPLGSYFAYSYTVPVTGNGFPDYPKFGIWHDGYYMSANSNMNNCVVFEREKLLAGDQSAGMVLMNFPNMPSFFRSVAPSYAEGPTLPDADEPFYFFNLQDNSFGASSDHIRVLHCDVDWETPSNSSITSVQTLETESFNSAFTNSWDDLVQKGSSQKLDAVPGIFMYRVQYRRFEDYNTVVLCHTVDVNNNNRAGIRWYELRDTNNGEWYIHQESTYSPDNVNSRFLGSISMDERGNMGLAYSFVGPDHYAGIRYTGRFVTDPLNEMTIEEAIVVEGQGAQTGGNRFGDYAQMTMDPSDDLTFWFTGEYLGSNGARRTRIFSFTSWDFLGEEEVEIKSPYFNAYLPYAGALKIEWRSLKDNNVNLSVIDMNGKTILLQNFDSDTNEKLVQLPSFAKGIYLIKLSGENTNYSKKVYLN